VPHNATIETGLEERIEYFYRACAGFSKRELSN
jgi:hypothetical protein